MKIRLQEIELGINNLHKSQQFYNEVLGLEISVDQAALSVFNSGMKVLTSTRPCMFPPKQL